MEELLKDKKIILVGPCKSLIGKNLGSYIDSFNRTYNSGYHSIEKEKTFLDNLCKNDERIKITVF